MAEQPLNWAGVVVHSCCRIKLGCLGFQCKGEQRLNNQLESLRSSGEEL